MYIKKKTRPTNEADNSIPYSRVYGFDPIKYDVNALKGAAQRMTPDGAEDKLTQFLASHGYTLKGVYGSVDYKDRDKGVVELFFYADCPPGVTGATGFSKKWTNDLAKLFGAESAEVYGDGAFLGGYVRLGTLDPSEFEHTLSTIPADISLEDFKRSYVGANAFNKRSRTPTVIVGCGVMKDGTEFVAYKSLGTAMAKTSLVTTLAKFVRIFVADPTGSAPAGTAPDISSYGDTAYKTKATPHPAYVVGSFVKDTGEDCLVLDSPNSPQEFSWTTVQMFNRRYTPIESAGSQEALESGTSLEDDAANMAAELPKKEWSSYETMKDALVPKYQDSVPYDTIISVIVAALDI